MVRDTVTKKQEQEEGLTVEQFLTKIKLMGMDDVFNKTAESVVNMAVSYMELLKNNHFLLDQIMLTATVKHLHDNNIDSISFSVKEVEECMNKYNDLIVMEVENNNLTFKIEGKKNVLDH